MKTLRLIVVALVLMVGAAVFVQAQRNQTDQNATTKAHDPGVRTGTIDAGGIIGGTTGDQPRYFMSGQGQFTEIEGVTLTSPGNGGLGPTFNGESCGQCHSQPSIGGTSPSATIFPTVGPNPQVADANDMGASNAIPFFVTADGPVREARFKSDGGVHDLFTIAGRSDAVGCTSAMLSQPNFQKQYDEGNLSFRIPTPVFGAGLVEAIDENTIIANMNANDAAKDALGIYGKPNRSGNDGSITRFGWKAQNKSLLMFAGEAYNVEMGVTNELMPNERGYPPNPIPTQCLFNPVPEDFTVASPMTSDPLSTLSDVEQFVFFMRFLDQPKQDPNGIPGNPSLTSIANGSSNFVSVGCAFCHTPSMTTTAKSDFAPAALQGVQANLFSDLLLHHMGKGLEDGITQGQAGPDQFRTAPLWGLGQRIFFLHDGRCADLVCAIEAHKSEGSEANKVIHNLDKLTTQQQQDLLNFLRSL